MMDPVSFRAALAAVPRDERETWLDRVLGIDGIPEDGPELPAGCVPYLPCAVDTLLRMVEYAAVGPGDVFVDVGAGLGRAAMTTHLLTGATVIGIEIQPRLVQAARELEARLNVARFSIVHGDAAEVAIPIGSVFFLYCPFGGARLAKVLAGLEAIARTRPIRVCCVDLPLPACAWLVPVAESGDLAVYRS